MVQPLGRHFLNRFQDGATKGALASLNEDLCILMNGLYIDAASSKDYQDDAHLALLLYAFGRGSDLGFVQTVTSPAAGVVFVRLLRVKTKEGQGISIFPDQVRFGTCPLHAFVIALVMEDTPSSPLLAHPQLAT
ncbi:LOW QUALITY PROTEIN: hypothetical protein PHMEG_00018262 [Phytophthora megakarya]|uniref:Uncharacterized protein n=1 Tax=Phytophthora megakarya TaxID=4795 RepID=A0A225VVS1_9STRA|nr:LOW QUALITY PROTEIN: hypothetical protein PHMEG_00018262 [Phytophthora megakarya]